MRLSSFEEQINSVNMNKTSSLSLLHSLQPDEFVLYLIFLQLSERKKLDLRRRLLFESKMKYRVSVLIDGADVVLTETKVVCSAEDVCEEVARIEPGPF